MRRDASAGRPHLPFDERGRLRGWVPGDDLHLVPVGSTRREGQVLVKGGRRCRGREAVVTVEQAQVLGSLDRPESVVDRQLAVQVGQVLVDGSR